MNAAAVVDGATIPVTVGSMPDSVAVPDVDHPGLQRAGPRASAPYARDNLERRVCAATDMVQERDEDTAVNDIWSSCTTPTSAGTSGPIWTTAAPMCSTR